MTTTKTANPVTVTWSCHLCHSTAPTGAKDWTCHCGTLRMRDGQFTMEPARTT